MKITRNILNYIKNRKIVNLFKTNFSKNVLISYIVYPLRFKKTNDHNNQLEIHSISKIFYELGFNVDVVFYKNDENLDFNKYDLVFGFGKTFEKSLNINNIKKIFYSTGSFPKFQNKQTKIRMLEVLKKTGKLMPESCRFNNDFNENVYLKSDAIILIGNENTKNTYPESLHSKIFTINSFYNKELVYSPLKEINKRRKNYLYFTSNGAIHRGLDILLEYFSRHKNLNLYISTNLKNEKQFMDIYKKELSLANIKYFGKNIMGSNKLNDIINNCLFTILPSVSEGQSTSITNMAFCGLIPIITKTCGTDLEKNGILIKNVNYNSINSAINKSQKLTNDQLKKINIKNKNDITNHYSLEKYNKNIRNILLKILEKENE